ncbi:MAG: hypothetical protein EZS28_011963 [Streblomastix strix]|uniref:Uncharacterized protein n=1 Tax=Streblomastix strix TaxID=222440 RepID=A0A5J4WCF4_9EUKA|nr:MAG: hypothetical protein EZS28_011963 [Streblomastix strix]
MSNVVTILGAAAGGGNAIIDISIDGKTLILEKNTSFVTNNYDETTTGQKTINITIHSVEIMVQTYDNNSIVCARGGLEAVSDKTANYYNKCETYSQTETNNLLNNKANTGVSYTKGEDDALLLLKADKTQLIDSYTKIETNNLLNNKADSGVSYSKSETYTKDEVYTKSEDDALLLLKADKTQLIDSYTKIETNNLLNNKADSGVSYSKGEDNALLLLKAYKTQLIDSYSKGEDNALLLLKADKTQLIDSYTKGKTYAKDEVYTKIETNNLLSSKAVSGISYTKGEDEALLLLKADKIQLIDSYTKSETNNLLTNKANQSTTYTKTEIDYLFSQIDVGDVDLTNYYNESKTDELLGEKADSDYVAANFVSTKDLANYVTLSASLTINANKTFQNSCRFVSIIDGMSTVTGPSFVKSGADNTVVLLGAGGTKPISEFVEIDNIYVRLKGSIQQTITGRLKYVSLFGGTDDETQDPVENTYLTQSDVDAKLTNYVNTTNNQSINRTKTFNANVNATGFVKTGKDDTSVLLAGG